MESAVAKGRGYEAEIAGLFTNAGFEVSYESEIC